MHDTPETRSNGLVSEPVDGGMVVFDVARDVAHSLSPEAARVWGCCDGERSVGQIAISADLGHDVAQRAVRELDDCRLLQTNGSRFSRREVVGGAARVGAGALILSAVIPASAAATTSGMQALTVSGNAHGTLNYTVAPAGSSGTVAYVSSLWVSHDGTVTEGGNPGNALQFTDNVDTLQLTNGFSVGSVTYSVAIAAGTPQIGTVTAGSASPNFSYNAGDSITVSASF